jgi:DNA-binding protein H-NS
MTIFTKLLRFLTQAVQTRRDVQTERAARTEKVIERYDEILNANATQRQRLTHPPGPRHMQS